ncbi:dimethylmenaquinone methyltransferase [Rugosimonospora acidiphila]|uniref:Putative 4-hydroxy-4-methyl-2-oxoglutarate aldolase n=1 Tax=Rugosimonospora acidiphila TaxID=556531 RepID=A0ABP9S1S4_9ACTN
MSIDQASQSDHQTETPAWELPVRGGPYERPDPGLIEGIRGISAASACAKLHAQGIRRTFMQGPRPLAGGQRVVGSALTLQFMPQREDVASGLGQEYIERRTALWAVLEAVRPGDVLVVQAYGDSRTGCLGDMLVRYFKRKGGAGIVVDGCVRDSARVAALGVPIWCTGSTPHYASQSDLFPWAYDVPVACGGALVLPGDIVLADDDGAVVVPRRRAGAVIEAARDHEQWEQFSRMRLDEGAPLADYYPLTPDSRGEYERWRDAGNGTSR